MLQITKIFSPKDVRVVKNLADSTKISPKNCKNADLVDAATEYGMTMLSMS